MGVKATKIMSQALLEQYLEKTSSSPTLADSLRELYMDDEKAVDTVKEAHALEKKAEDEFTQHFLKYADEIDIPYLRAYEMYGEVFID